MPRINQTSQETKSDLEIHNIIILDRSGSMSGSKWEAAKKGVELDYENCKKEGFKSYTFVQFDYPGRDIVQYCDFKSPLKFSSPNGMTALYDSIGNTLTSAFARLTGKVLVKIFTDGEENASVKYHAEQIKELIKEAESKGYTVTFVGTEQDALAVNRSLNIDMSNIAVHDNTGEGVRGVFESYAVSTSAYTKTIREGGEATRGFFSKTIK